MQTKVTRNVTSGCKIQFLERYGVKFKHSRTLGVYFAIYYLSSILLLVQICIK